MNLFQIQSIGKPMGERNLFMKRVLLLFALFAFIVGLSGCGKPPKEVARKITLSYLEENGLTLDDIKYLSAYAKDGGYTVNIQAGDALCEMPMIKGEKDWMAKGISCNGPFLSQDERAKRKRTRIIESLKKEVADLNAKGPETLDNGIRIEKYAFDGSRYSVKMISPLKPSGFTQEIKNKITSQMTEFFCSKQEIQDVISAGLTYGADVYSTDGTPLFTVTVGNYDCQHLGGSESNDSAATGKGSTGGSGIQSVTTANWDNEILRSKGLVVVNFYAAWSGPSQQLDTTISELANEYAGKMKARKLNADENTKVAAKYQIKGIPTIIFFKDGQKVDQIVGAAQKSIIKAKIDFYL